MHPNHMIFHGLIPWCIVITLFSVPALAAPETTLESLGSSGMGGNADTWAPDYSPDPEHRYVSFTSLATNLDPLNHPLGNGINSRGLVPRANVFIRDRQTGVVLEVVGHNYMLTPPEVSPDGPSGASHLMGELGMKQLTTDRVPPDGPSGASHLALHSDGHTTSPVMIIESEASNLVSDDFNNLADIFYCYLNFDPPSPDVSCMPVSVNPSDYTGNGASRNPVISPDGAYAAFESAASDLVENDTNGWSDIFLYSHATAQITRVSLGVNGRTGLNEANDDSGAPAISSDGSHVAYHSYASNLVNNDTNGVYDIFVTDITGLDTGDPVVTRTERVSVAADGTEANGGSYYPTISDDGRYVAFQSDASNLVPGDTNGCTDIFVYDRRLRTIRRVSVAADGSQARGTSWYARISGNGRFVTFYSNAYNLVPGDYNGVEDVFAYDLGTGAIQRISVSRTGGDANGRSGNPSISADGLFVGFSSQADNLVDNDANGRYDAFLRGPLDWPPLPAPMGAPPLGWLELLLGR